MNLNKMACNLELTTCFWNFHLIFSTIDHEQLTQKVKPCDKEGLLAIFIFKMGACVCVHACACVCVCMCACMCVHMRVCVHVCVNLQKLVLSLQHFNSGD